MEKDIARERELVQSSYISLFSFVYVCMCERAGSLGDTGGKIMFESGI